MTAGPVAQGAHYGNCTLCYFFEKKLCPCTPMWCICIITHVLEKLGHGGYSLVLMGAVLFDYLMLEILIHYFCSIIL